jgi:hypothetical protein
MHLTSNEVELHPKVGHYLGQFKIEFFDYKTILYFNPAKLFSIVSILAKASALFVFVCQYFLWCSSYEFSFASLD